MSRRRTANYWLHASGSFVFIISALFIAFLMWSQRHVIMEWHPDSMALLILGLGILVYAADGFLLACAWRQLLLWSGESSVDIRDACRIYGRSQIAKYIPGNFAQLVGRHVIGRQLGWSHTGLILAAIFELVSLLSVASLIALVGLALSGIVQDRLQPTLLIALAAGIFVMTVLVLRGGPPIMKRRWPEVAERLRRCRLSQLALPLLLHLVFFTFSGCIFLLIVVVVLDRPFSLLLWPGVIGLMAISWAAGVVTPGAPSGLGVRETVLTLGLASVAPMGEALLAAVLFRIVTLCGDIFFFVFAVCLKRFTKLSQNHVKNP